MLNKTVIPGYSSMSTLNEHLLAELRPQGVQILRQSCHGLLVAALSCLQFLCVSAFSAAQLCFYLTSMHGLSLTESGLHAWRSATSARALTAADAT